MCRPAPRATRPRRVAPPSAAPALALALALAPPSTAADPAPVPPPPAAVTVHAPTEEEWRELRETVRVLLAEVAEVRDGEATARPEHVPGPDRRATSLGGYGEFYFAQPTGGDDAVRTADLYRFVTYIGHEFDERIHLLAEIELEHATTEAGPAAGDGSVSVELAVLDFRVGSRLSVRAGNLLVPSGFVNRMHEPPFYRGNFRPTVERTLLPSTWRELGAGVHGRPIERLALEAYVINGLDASGFGPGGVRGGRQKGARARWEDVAGALALDWTPVPALGLGGSIVSGPAGQGRTYDGEAVDAWTTVAEGHAEVRVGGLRGRALLATTSIGDATRLSAELGETIPQRQLGGYLELAWNVAPRLGLPAGQALHVWMRGERLDLAREVPDGLAADPSLDSSSLALGVDWLPHARVVVKVDWTREDDESGAGTTDPLRVGAGWVF